MPNGITRRDFLRYAAAAAGSLWLASLTSSLAPSARGASPQQVVAPAPSFQALPAPTLLGAPVDVGIGGDGVQWVLGESGAPSSYDPLQQTWLPFGGGIDAAAYIPFVDSNENFSVALCYFRGGEVYKSGAAGPMSIASLWPNLPPSFQQGVDGATYLNDKDGNTFLLFRQGQIAAVNVWGQVSVGLLTEYGGMGWPSGAWQDGLFDYVISGKDPAFPGYAIFVRGGEYIVANLAQAIITTAPQPLSAGFGGAAAMLLAQDDIQAVVCTGAVLATGAPLHVFSGPVVYTLENSTATAPPQAQYLGEAIAGWPAAWHPMLQAAPAGSVGCAASPGNLWSLDRAGTPLWNAGSGWTPMPLPGNTPAGSLDVGADGSVFAVAANSLYSLAAGAWGATSLPTGTLAQVSVGDASHVWVRDVQGYVFRAAGGTVRPANLGVAVTDMQANTDGTLWHCSAGLGSAYRYISEGQQSSEALAIGLDVTSVLKTASSGFGTGFFLAQQGGQSALIRYTSPYLFKTSGQYSMAGQQQIAAGAASIFLFCETPAVGGGWDFFVVALDVQTGAERWRYAYPSSREASGYTPLYDAQHQLVYVFQAIGVVQALDAQTGTLRWTLALPPAAAGQPAIPTQPVLYDGMIYTAAYDNPALAPNSSTVYLIAVDTRDAAQRAANNQPVVARWTYSYNVPGQQVAPLPPVVFEGSVYGAVWSLANQQLQLSLLQVEVLTGLGSDLFDASIFGSGPNNGGSSAPIIGRLTTDPSNTVGSLIINAGTAGIYGIFLDGSETIYHYSPQALEGAPVSTNLVIFDGAVYFCDSSGNLYGLDASLNPLPGLPTTFIGSALNFTGITVAGDENGQAVVIAGDTSNNTLCFYSTATGNLLTLATNQTAITALSDVTHDGIVYVGGTTVNSLGQVFAIRTSEVGALRDFVVESQLMQDYDIGAVTTARYQTHVTVVDGSKTPLPFTGVKIWADSALSVQVDGQPYAIGPDTPLATQVDAAGSLTIVSDATDLFATPLRVWAAFMDPFERIVVFPDQEFHARLPSMTADAGNDDPTVINLATGTNYAGTKIFTNQQEAQAVAQAVGAACKASGIGGSGSASAGAPAGAPRCRMWHTTTCRACGTWRTTRRRAGRQRPKALMG
ncbi:MAG: PQQ-binding-like beta-propeller repeat protein [Caldilineaceae bacterium]